jgi:hypothetical protein
VSELARLLVAGLAALPGATPVVAEAG